MSSADRRIEETKAYLNAILTTAAAATTATATATGSIVTRFAAAARALDLERVAAEVDAVHLVNRIVGIAWIVVLQESKLDLDGDVANAAEFAEQLVQLTLADVGGQIADVNPAHRNMSTRICKHAIPFECWKGCSPTQSHRQRGLRLELVWDCGAAQELSATTRVRGGWRLRAHDQAKAVRVRACDCGAASHAACARLHTSSSPREATAASHPLHTQSSHGRQVITPDSSPPRIFHRAWQQQQHSCVGDSGVGHMSKNSKKTRFDLCRGLCLVPSLGLWWCVCGVCERVCVCV